MDTKSVNNSNLLENLFKERISPSILDLDYIVTKIPILN